MPSNDRNVATALVGSRRTLLLALLPVLVLLGALAPASAMAGDTGGGPCSATVRADDDPRIATFSLNCGDGNNIETATLRTNEENEGSVEGDDDTECEEVSNREFNCSPAEPPASSIGGRFTIDGEGEDVCAEPRLEISFEVDLEDESTEEVNDVVVEGCPSSGSGGDDDSGATPEGGVDSGFGATESASSTALPLVGAGLVVVLLVSAGLLVRRTRTTP